MHSSKNKLLSYQCLPIWKDMAPSLVPTTFMIKPRQLPEALNFSCPESYDMKKTKANLKLFLVWSLFHSSPDFFSFPLGSFFISCWGLGDFLFLPRKFSFPAWGFSFHPLEIFHSLPRSQPVGTGWDQVRSKLSGTGLRTKKGLVWTGPCYDFVEL